MTTLGRYEILDKIGAGSMGTVYKANDTVLDRLVALKTIRTGSEVEPELRERFYREAKACARLQHPGIVTVYDLGEVDRTAYIAMELMVGSDFRKIIDERTEIPLDRKIEAMAEVCEALAHAHKHGIIHRDIKPSNLFLSDSGHAKVLDFGIARLPSSRLTVAGRILGTPNYMAPEQILARPTDTRSDLFSAAVVFFEFLVYVHPFQSDLIPKRVAEGQPDSLFDHNSQLPMVLDKILSRALSTDPARRYRTGDEFAADLRALLDAMRQNASPTFSRMELPSDRELPPTAEVPVRALDPSLLTQPPPGEDPHEWRLSEVLRLIPEFEDALERTDGAKAWQVFRQLEAIESVDARFADALELCKTRLSGIPEPPRPVAPKPAPPRAPAAPTPGFQTSVDPPTAPKNCGQCGASNRGAAVFCISCGAPFVTGNQTTPIGTTQTGAASTEPVGAEIDDSVTRQFMALKIPPAPPKPASAPPPPLSEPPAAQRSAPPPPPPSQAGPAAHRPAPKPLPKPSMGAPLQKQTIAIIAGGAALVVILVVVLMLALRQPPVEKALATAVVSAPNAILYKNPDADSGGIATLARGDRVNILRLPRERDQEWVQSQFVSPAKKVSRPGYLRVHDLDPEGWDSTDPVAKLDLIRAFHAGESGDDAAIQSELDALRRFEAKFPNTTASREAELDQARLELALTRRLKDDGQAPEVWLPRLDSVRQHLQTASSEASLRGDVELVLGRADQLAAQAKPPETTPVARKSPAPVRSTVPASAPVRTAEAVRPPARPQTDESLGEAQRLLEEVGDARKQLDNLTQAEKIVDKVLKDQPSNQKALQLQGRIKRVKAALQ